MEENFNLNQESNDSNEDHFSKDELIEIFEANEEDISNGLSDLLFKLKIGDYEDVFMLLELITEQLKITSWMFSTFFIDEFGDLVSDEDENEEDELDDFFDLENRLN